MKDEIVVRLIETEHAGLVFQVTKHPDAEAWEGRTLSKAELSAFVITEARKGRRFVIEA